MMRAGVIPMLLCGFAALVGSMAAASASQVSDAGFERAIESALPRVVKLYGLGAGRQAGYGSGVIVSPEGHVLTVFSLLIDARHIRAVAADGTPYEAKIVHRDRERQLALLKLGPGGESDEAASPASPAPWPYFDLSQQVTARVGDWVLAAGNAFKVADGSEPASIAHGVLSARTRLDARRRLKDYPYHGEVLVVDAITSNPGSPGSALVNLDGEFLGMIGRVVRSNLTHTQLNYAMPRDVLHAFWLEATSGDDTRVASTEDAGAESSAPIDLGIKLSRVGYQTILPFVERIRPGSPADRAGVRKDDLILSINGRNVSDVKTYDTRLRRLLPGEPVELVIRRGRGIVSVRIEVE